MRNLPFALMASAVAAAPALASRPVTAEERARIEEALKALGCSGGKVEFDDHKFEVERAASVDARTYGFDFDRQYKLIRMRPD
jgi:hypothetical protein